MPIPLSIADTLPPESAAALSPAAHFAGQIVALFVLAIPIACVAWTVTHEEIFREPREYCQRRCKECSAVLTRKFFYLFTCEYCFSHYVTAGLLLMTGFRLYLNDWRGLVLSFFSLVWVANVYMNLYGRLRVELRSERTQIQAKEKEIQKIEQEICEKDGGRGMVAAEANAGHDGQG